MVTKILISVIVPEKFDSQEFKSQFIKECEKYGINVYEFKKWKNDIEQPGDNATFQFETDYDFNAKDLVEGYIVEYIYDELISLKNRFNEKSKIKLETVNVLK